VTKGSRAGRAGIATIIVGFWIALCAQLAHAQSWLPDDDAIGAAAGDQDLPSVARGGDIVLAAWSDRRSYPPGASTFFDWETAGDIYAMRLDAAGNPLDSVPFVVTQGKANQLRPRIAWNGANWLVVFESTRLGGTGFYYEPSLEAVRVSPSGEILDQDPILITNVTPQGGDWTVSSDGTDWVLVYQTSAATTALQALRITAAGVVEQPTSIIVPATYFMRSDFHLAYTSGVFLLTWNDFSDTMSIRFGRDLVPLDPAPKLLVPAAHLGGLVASDTQFYTVWLKQRVDFSLMVAGSRISTAGALLDASGVNVSGTSTPQFDSSPSVDWDGALFRVAWGTSPTALRLGRVNAAGAVLDPNGVAVPGPQAGLLAATADGGVQVVWGNQSAQFDLDILSAHVNAANTAGPNFPLSSGAPQQTRADVARGSSGYMVVFRSDVSGLDRIVAQPLDLAGNPTTAGPVTLVQGDNTFALGLPTVAWNGSVYLITWPYAIGIVAQRIRQDATLVDAAPFDVMPGFGNVDVAALGDVFLVIAHQLGSGNPEIIFPVVSRVRGSDGVVLDPAGRVIGGSFTQSVAVTRLGGRWLAAWQQNVNHDETAASTNGAFIDPSGTSSSPFTIYGPYFSSGGNGAFEVAIAGGANTALLVQSDERSSNVETDLVGRVVNADGTLRPSFVMTPWSGNQYYPRVAWDGSQFVVAYHDQKNRFAPLTLDPFDATSDLFGMRVSATGTIIDRQGFAFSLSPAAEANPNVAAGGGVSLILGSIMRNAPYDAYRIGYKLFGVGGNAWPVPSATSNSTGGDIPLTVDFSSAGSTDPNGTIASLLWDFGDGATSTEANPSHLYNAPGQYVATLTVTDNAGVSSVDTEALDVTAPNVLPVAVASATPTTGPSPLDVTFFAEGSYDPDGSLGNLEWHFDDGGSYFGSIAFNTFTTPGVHHASLTVHDSRGGTSTDTVSVFVQAPNAQPIVIISATPTSGDAPLTVSFSSAGTRDPDGTIVSYAWTFGDGGTSSEQNPSHLYTSAGTYAATLTVTDNRGAKASRSVQIRVTGDCFVNCLRSTDIQLSGQPNGNNVRIRGSVFVKNENGARVPQAQVTVQWTKPNGSHQTFVTYTDNRGIASFSVGGPHGTYTLTVQDIGRAGLTFDPNHSVLSKDITF
jgi:PKD repeat protein